MVFETMGKVQRNLDIRSTLELSVVICPELVGTQTLHQQPGSCHGLT